MPDSKRIASEATWHMDNMETAVIVLDVTEMAEPDLFTAVKAIHQAVQWLLVEAKLRALAEDK